MEYISYIFNIYNGRKEYENKCVPDLKIFLFIQREVMINYLSKKKYILKKWISRQRKIN